MRTRTLKGLILLFILGFASPLWAQSGASVQYVYDALGRLTSVVDPSGNVATYNYDAVGNLLSITRSTSSPSALAVFGFSPTQGSLGQTVVIQGQNFSTTLSADTVQFNGTTATVTAATVNSLTVTVPAAATTGPISVTVGTSTATSSSNFTVLAVPVITSITPTQALNAPTVNFTVNGSNLTGATFSFVPAFTPAAISISNVNINGNGTSATMTLMLASNATGSFTVVGTNGTGSTSSIPSTSNTLTIVPTDPFADSDGDGLSNIYEAAIGTNYAAASTTGDGLPDGWALFYTSTPPLNAALAGQTAANGLTYLQSFQRGLNPLLNTVAPSVSSVYPANGTTNYPTNGVIVVRFTEPLLAGVSLTAAQNAINAALPTGSNFSSANASAAAQVLQAYLQRTCCGTSAVPGVVQVLQNGRSVAGSVSLSNDRLSITFAPTLNLSASTTYTVSAQNVRDAAGNLMTQPFQSSFTTGVAANKITGGSVFTNPPNGATGVETNAPFRMLFSSPVNPATLTTQTFFITDTFTGLVVPGARQVDPFGLTASFVPSQPYGAGRQFSVTLTSGIQDVSGNSFPASSFFFTTGFGPDNQGFKLVGTSPSDGATGVPLNALVVLEFEEPVDEISALTGLQVQLAGAPISGAIALSDGNKRITFTPTVPLTANSTYLVVTTSRLTDFSGNQLSNPDSSTFTTGNANDNTPAPTVVSVSPASTASGVPTNTRIQLKFSKPIDPLTVTNSTFSVFPSFGGPIAASISVSADGLTATLTPTSPLVEETSYVINPTSGITDLVGQGLQPGTICFACVAFTTGLSTTTTTPTVVTVSPPNGISGVQVNARINVLLSAPVGVASVGSNAITVSAGGTAVAGTISLSSNETTLTFVPSSLLAVSTTYTVSVSGFTDQAGNTVVPFSSTFTTGTSGVADTTFLAVLSVSPATGATGVPVNSSIVVTFNKNVDPRTVNSTSVAISSSPLFLGLAGTYAVNGAVVTFTPISPLPGSATVQVSVGGVLDLAGNGIGVGFTSSFTTAAVADTTAPQVVAVTPNNGATGIGPNATVVLTFSKSVNPNTVNANTVGLLVNGTKLSNVSFTTSPDNRVVTMFLIGGTLPASSTVAVLATSGVTDFSGNALVNFESTFTTAYDTTHASVIGQRPANGATGVPVNTGVVLYVNELMNTTTIPGALHISQNGVPVNGTMQLTDNGQVIQFIPSAPFQNNALVQVFLDSTALDVDGNSLSSYQASFSTAADTTTTGPFIVNTNPSNFSGIPTNVVIDLGFNETLNPATVNTTTVSLMQGTTVVPSTVNLVGNGTIIQITPSSVLAPNTTYGVNLTAGLQGSNGLSDTVDGPGIVLSFTTGSGTDTVNPTVVLVSPPDGFGNVGDNANIRVRFSKAINPLTVTGSTISISGGGITQMPYALSFISSQEVLIAPYTPLPDATQMSVAVSGVTDVAGNAVVAKTTHFSTGTGPDTVIPAVMSSNPFSGEKNVPLNSPIMVGMNEPIDAGTVNNNTLSIQDRTTSQLVLGSYSVSADGQTISFVPSSLLSVGRTYFVSFASNGIADLAGNPLSNPGGRSNFFFTAGATANATQPQVVGVSPPNGLTGVPINAQVVIQFNEPIDGATISQVTLSGGGTVTVTPAFSNGNQTLTLVSVGPLNSGTTYTVSITGVQDIGGNSLPAPVTTSFTTGTGADLTPPRVVSVSPANNATGIPTNTVNQLRFSKRINPLTVTTATFYIYPTGTPTAQPIAGNVTVSSDAMSATFTPARLLVPETTYTINTLGITDLEGQALQFFSPSFTTGLGTATTAPTVLTVSPPNGISGVQVNARINALLSAPVGVASVGSNAITVSTNGTPVAGTISVSSDGATLTFVPSSLLAVSTTYTVNVSGFTDQAGNTVVPFTSTFTTGTSGVADTTFLAVLSVSPATGATGVPVNSSIVVTFNKNVDPRTVNSTSVALLDNSFGLAGTYAVNGAVVTFTPISPLPGSTTLQVSVNGGTLDLAGNGIGVGFTSSFTTAAGADTTVPQVVAVTPNNGSTGIGLNAAVVLTFSKSLNPNTINTNNFGLLANGNKLGVSLSHSADNSVVTLSAGALPPTSTMAVFVTNGVTDLSGNALANFESQFTTAAAFDTTHGGVVNQRPGNGTTGAPLNTGVVLYVNEPVNAATIAGALHISQNGVLVNGTGQVTNNGQVIQFTPSAAFQNGALVQVFLDSTALDADGSSLANYQGSFTTAVNTSAVTPTVVNTNPGQNSANIPTNVVIDIGFNETLNPTTVNTTTVSLLQGSSGVTSTVSLVGGGAVIQVTPSAALAANTSYAVSLTNGVQGTNGLALAFTGTYLTFRTGAATDTVNPSVVIVSPPNGALNVGDNASLRVHFSKAINPLTVNATTMAVSSGSGTQVPYALSFTTNQDVSIVPFSPLPDATQVTIAISGVTDVAGNPVQPALTTHFTTGNGADLTTPVLVNVNPSNGATAVPLNAVVQVLVNKPVDPGRVNSTTLTITDNVTRQALAGTYSVSSDGVTISFVPSALLTASRNYSVSGAGITDLVGNFLPGPSFSFTTGTTTSTSAPQVAGTSPANGATAVPINTQVVIQFNEPVDALTVNQVTLSGGAAVNVTRTLTNGNQMLVLVPLAPLSVSTSYTVTIAGVQDISGNALAAPVTASFTTGTGADLTPPSVTSVSPTNGATGVLTHTTIQLQFSKQIDPLTVTNSTFTVSLNSNGQLVAGTINVSANGLTATFTPTAPLSVSTAYRVSASASDLEGQSLFFSSSFTTGTQ